MRKLDKWRTKEEVAGLKLSTAVSVLESDVFEKFSKDVPQDLRGASGPSVDPSTVHRSPMYDLSGRVAIQKPFVWKGNSDEG